MPSSTSEGLSRKHIDIAVSRDHGAWQVLGIDRGLKRGQNGRNRIFGAECQPGVQIRSNISLGGDLYFERGTHDCHLYRTWAERSDVTVSFVYDGLRNGEHCLVVSGADSFDMWRKAIRACGIDPAREELRGALSFVTGESWREHASNSIIMARNTLNLLKPLLKEFSGVRIVGDAEWDLDPPVAPDDLCHWEATANLVFEDSDVRAVCQYDVTQRSPSMLHGAIRTHPQVIWDGERRENRFYEAPRILRHEPYLNESTADAAMVQHMLAQL